jgi:hypothetical protein
MLIMKKFKKVVSVALASVMTMGMGVISASVVSADTNTTYDSLSITKDVVVQSETVKLPEEKFVFTMTPVADLTGNDAEGNKLETGPALTTDTVKIAFNGDSKSDKVSSYYQFENTGSFSFDDAFLDNFDHAGVYRYEVKETGAEDYDGGALSSAAYIEFDDTTYYIDLYVSEQDKDDFAVTNIVRSIKDKTGKPNDIVFTNKYNCADLKIEKNVEGTEYKKGDLYDFYILIPVGGTTIDLKSGMTFTAQIYDDNGLVNDDRSDEKGNIEIKVNGSSITDDVKTTGTKFQLKNGEYLEINDLPTTMIYKVIEDTDYTDDNGVAFSDKKYSVSYQYLEDGKKKTETLDNNTDPLKNEEGSAVQGTINTKENAVTFINERTVNVPEGISLDVLPYVLIVLVAACGGVLFVIRRKKSSK